MESLEGIGRVTFASLIRVVEGLLLFGLIKHAQWDGVLTGAISSHMLWVSHTRRPESILMAGS